jgi:hypothetical protein
MWFANAHGMRRGKRTLGLPDALEASLQSQRECIGGGEGEKEEESPDTSNAGRNKDRAVESEKKLFMERRSQRIGGYGGRNARGGNNQGNKQQSKCA